MKNTLIITVGTYYPIGVEKRFFLSTVLIGILFLSHKFVHFGNVWDRALKTHFFQEKTIRKNRFFQISGLESPLNEISPKLFTFFSMNPLFVCLQQYIRSIRTL
jgi:hypothetical protein